MCVCIGWIGEWLHFPGSPNKTKVWCVFFGVLCVFTLLLNNTTSLINVLKDGLEMMSSEDCQYRFVLTKENLTCFARKPIYWCFCGPNVG